MPYNPLNAQKTTDSNFDYFQYTNKFWWVGGNGVGVTTGTSKDAYTWNNASNWKFWNPLDGGVWSTATRVPGSVNGSNDIVFVGGLSFGPTAYAPLLYGGFSGSSTTGGYATSTGLTFDAGTTTTNTILEVNIKWEYGYEQKYPFNVVGGGLNSLYSMGVTSGSITGVSAAYGATFGEYFVNPHYQSLKLKAQSFKEESSRANNKSIFLNLVKAVSSAGYPVGLFTKGSGGSGNSWNNGPSSRSKIHLTGFLNEFRDESRPSDNFIRTSGDITQIRQDYTDLSQGLYGYPEVNLGWNSSGLTLGSYVGYNLCTVVVDNNSTVGKMNINTLYSYPNTTQYLGLPDYPLTVLGEISDKPLAALGYTLTGGLTGVEYGKLSVNTFPEIFQTTRGITSSQVNVAIGNFLNYSGVTGVGYTGSAKISSLEIFNNYLSLSPTNLVFMGSVAIADAKVVNTKISAWRDAQNSSIDIGSLRMSRQSELLLNAAPNINSWSFGLLPAAGTTTQILGGIYADDTCTIRTSSDIVLFNKNINNAVSSDNFVADTNNNILSTARRFVARSDDIAELPLP